MVEGKKQLDNDLKINLNGKRHYETDSHKYLGNQIDKNITWKQQINHLTWLLTLSGSTTQNGQTDSVSRRIV